MKERVLSARALNRALLARQLLLERSELPLPQALERVAGLQTQYAPSAYVSLWSRLHDFRRKELTRALEQRAVVQATLMRATIHMVSAGDFPLLASALRKGRRAWWLRVQQKALQGIDMEAVAARVRQHLADGPRRAAELQSLLRADGYPRIAAVSAGMWIDIVRVPPSGTWDQRRADLYGLADQWLGTARAAPEAAGLEHLVRRYLGGFGPAPLNDLASWAGLPRAILQPVVERLRLRRFRDEQGGELLDLPGAPLPDPERSGARAFPANLGRDAARARPAHPDPPGSLPPLSLSDQDPALGLDIPRRRGGRGDVALREGPGAARTVQTPATRRTAGPRG